MLYFSNSQRTPKNTKLSVILKDCKFLSRYSLKDYKIYNFLMFFGIFEFHSNSYVSTELFIFEQI